MIVHGVKGIMTLFLTGHPQLEASKTPLFISCMADICLRSLHRRHKLSGPKSLFPALTFFYVPSSNTPLCSQ